MTRRRCIVHSALMLKFVLPIDGWLMITLVSVAAPAEAYNYCNNKKLCPEGVKHYMCEPESIVPESSKTKYLAHAPMSNKLRQLLLDTHNKFRNEIAGGTVTNGAARGDKSYPKAVRMRELLWDKELAYIAHVHAAQCTFAHDKCHNTVRFPHSGQNLGTATGSKAQKISEFIVNSLTLMNDEKNLVDDPERLASKYEALISAAGHFTVLVNDQVSFVGCAVAYCKGCGSPHCYYMTCNYDMTNIQGNLIYKAGDTAASKCDEWKAKKNDDEKYPNLCTNTGKLFHEKL